MALYVTENLYISLTKFHVMFRFYRIKQQARMLLIENTQRFFTLKGLNELQNRLEHKNKFEYCSQQHSGLVYQWRSVHKRNILQASIIKTCNQQDKNSYPKK